MQKRFVVLLFAILIGGITAFRIVGNDIQSFLRKGQDNVSLSDSFERSRGFIIIQQLENFSDNIYTGIGFGIAQSYSHEQQVTYFAGIPVSAATEKANLPISILEEVGVLGLISMLPFFRSYFRNSKFQGLAIIFLCLIYRK